MNEQPGQWGQSPHSLYEWQDAADEYQRMAEERRASHPNWRVPVKVWLLVWFAFIMAALFVFIVVMV